jgi:hypothetical protein
MKLSNLNTRRYLKVGVNIYSVSNLSDKIAEET